MEPNAMNCGTPEALRFLASACERPIEDEWMRKAADEIERLRLTDAEREAVEWCVSRPQTHWQHGIYAATLRGLLERLGAANSGHDRRRVGGEPVFLQFPITRRRSVEFLPQGCETKGRA